MKKTIFILILIISNLLFANEKDIIGKWKTEGPEPYLVQIFKSGDNFNGKIISIYKKDNSIIDNHQENKIIGMDFLVGFRYKKGKYINGKINDPNSGKIYYCKMKIKNNKLIVRGSLDKFGFAGQSQYWVRIE